MYTANKKGLTMFKSLINKFKCKVKEPWVYEISGTWGNAIHFCGDWKKNRVYGWKWRRPKVEDLLVVPMESGETVIFKFKKVKCESNPHDMFFADVSPMGYLKDMPQKTKEIILKKPFNKQSFFV